MLWEMTEKALEVLGENSNGFFLMVEGGMIDKLAWRSTGLITPTSGWPSRSEPVTGSCRLAICRGV